MLKKIIEYLFVIGLILCTNTVYSHSLNYDFSSKIFFLITLIIVFIYVFISKKAIIRKKYLLSIVLYLFALLIWFLAGGVNTSNKHEFYLTFLIILPLLLILYFVLKIDIIYELFEKFVFITFIISIISTTLYILGPVLNVLKPTNNVILTWEEYPKNIPSYFNLLFSIQKISFFNKAVIRNTGMFTEAPMFSTVLIIAYALKSLILKEQKKYYIDILLLITVITTFSTIGLVLFGLIFLLKVKLYYANDKIMKKYNKIFLIITLIAVALISIIIIVDKRDTASYHIRMDDYASSFKAWTEKPIFGHGFGNNESIYKYMKKNRYNGMSNAIGILLVQGGLWLTNLLFIFPMLSSISYSKITKRKEFLYFSIIIAIIYIGVSIPYNPIILNFIALELSLIVRKEKLNEI